MIFSTDMRWDKHIEYIYRRSYGQLQTIRKQKKLDADQKILVDIDEKQIRSILEYAAPAWCSMITVENLADIERVQKCAYFMIFGPSSYQKYLSAINKVSLQDDSSQRLNFYFCVSVADFLLKFSLVFFTTSPYMLQVCACTYY